MLKVLFAGTPDVAVPSLRALVNDPEHFDVVAVLTRPDAPYGRGRKIISNPVKTAALELGLPVIESDPSEETFIDELIATGAEAAAVVAYGRILNQDVIDALPQGWYNLHFSLLPQWRGAAPVQRAIWAGDTVTGTTVFRITSGLDSGPILAQSTVTVGAHETAGELLNRLAEDGSHLLLAALQGMADDEIVPVEQPQGSYEVAHKITVDDAHIRFDVPVFAVDRQIRACTPHPGAWCKLYAHGDMPQNNNDSHPVHKEPTADSAPAENEVTTHQKHTEQATPDTVSAATPAKVECQTADTPAVDTSVVLHVLSARPADMESPAVPRDVQPGRLYVGKRNVWVGTASDPLELLEVKAQGKKAMAAADWARGARLDDGAYCY